MHHKAKQSASAPSSAVNLTAGTLKRVKFSGVTPMAKPVIAKPGAAMRTDTAVAQPSTQP